MRHFQIKAIVIDYECKKRWYTSHQHKRRADSTVGRRAADAMAYIDLRILEETTSSLQQPNKSPEPLWGLSIGMMGLSKSLLDKMFITRSATEWSGVVREAMWLTNP
jgi:hypothetical protein